MRSSNDGVPGVLRDNVPRGKQPHIDDRNCVHAHSLCAEYVRPCVACLIRVQRITTSTTQTYTHSKRQSALSSTYQGVTGVIVCKWRLVVCLRNSVCVWEALGRCAVPNRHKWVQRRMPKYSMRTISRDKSEHVSTKEAGLHCALKMHACIHTQIAPLRIRIGIRQRTGHFVPDAR